MSSSCSALAGSIPAVSIAGWWRGRTRMRARGRTSEPRLKNYDRRGDGVRDIYPCRWVIRCLDATLYWGQRASGDLPCCSKSMTSGSPCLSWKPGRRVRQLLLNSLLFLTVLVGLVDSRMNDCETTKGVFRRFDHFAYLLCLTHLNALRIRCRRWLQRCRMSLPSA